MSEVARFDWVRRNHVWKDPMGRNGPMVERGRRSFTGSIGEMSGIHFARRLKRFERTCSRAPAMILPIPLDPPTPLLLCCQSHLLTGPDVSRVCSFVGFH